MLNTSFLNDSIGALCRRLGSCLVAWAHAFVSLPASLSQNRVHHWPHAGFTTSFLETSGREWARSSLQTLACRGDYAWDYIGEHCKGYIGIMEKKMETSIWGLGFRF